MHEAEFPGIRAVVPRRHIAIVTCTDSRIDTFAMFGLDSGEAHIIRNAGGLVTDDVLTRVREHRYLPRRDRVRGFVYDVDSGHLREVE